jgi:ribonuclease BN (tRNA processing enzyme)
MRLTVVGSGTAAPHPARVASGHLVEAPGVCLLLDCGSGVVHRLASLGLSWPAITHVALTHFHYDHVGDLPALITAFRWGQLPPRAEPLTLVGPPGTDAWLDRVAAAHGPWVREPGYPLHVVEMDGTTPLALLPSALSLSGFPVPHAPESMAYSISSARARLVYTGDTPYDDRLADWASGCDVLLTECSLPAPLAVEGHLTPESAGALAARVKPGRMVLTHFYPPVEPDDIPSLVRAQWAGPLVLAHDGTALDIQE